MHLQLTLILQLPHTHRYLQIVFNTRVLICLRAEIRLSDASLLGQSPSADLLGDNQATVQYFSNLFSLAMAKHGTSLDLFFRSEVLSCSKIC